MCKFCLSNSNIFLYSDYHFCLLNVTTSLNCPVFIHSPVCPKSLLTVLVSLFHHGGVKRVSLVMVNTGFVKCTSGHLLISKE